MRQSEHTAGTDARSTPRISDQDISNAYVYLLGRLLVLRQEHLDFRNGGFKSAGFKWNELIHRQAGGFGWANPNLDVAYSEAWIAIDETSYTVIDIPPISDRYYTIQVLNLWGETIANINERNYPNHPSGAFAFCLRGTRMTVPTGTVRIDLPSRKARILVRVELGADPDVAIALQRAITMRASASPRISAPITIPMFTNSTLPGVEAFDTAPAVLASEPDINPGAAALQATVRAVAMMVATNKHDRERVDGVIRQFAWLRIKQAVAEMGVRENGWIRPRVAGNYGADWTMRTVANFTGIWANNQSEVVYFGTGSGTPINGSQTYTMTFPKDNLPGSHVDYFWSVTCVDSLEYRVVPNAENRFALNGKTPLVMGPDGSLTLYFAAEKPPDAPNANWLPTPARKNYLLTWRAYGPDQAIVNGRWFPPSLYLRT